MELLSVPCVPSNADWGLVATGVAVWTMRSQHTIHPFTHCNPFTQKRNDIT